MSVLQCIIHVGTHDIQEYGTRLSKTNGQLTLDFVQNSSAKGALLVFGNTEFHDFDYIPIMNSKINDVTEFNITDPDNGFSCSSNCTLFVYTLKSNGLPGKHNGDSSISPVYHVDNYSYSKKENSSEMGMYKQ